MCGIVGVFNAEGASALAAGGLHHIQPRARDYTGMVSSDGMNMYPVYGEGGVRHVLTAERLARLRGKHALGHIRYPTVQDDPERENIQPVLLKGVALAHNGNLTNHEELRERIERNGPLATSMDSECILRLFLDAEGDEATRIQSALAQVRGSYAVAMLFRDKLLVARDPSGNRPLFVGRNAESWFCASETVALEVFDAVDIREVKPGEIFVIDRYGCVEYHISDTADSIPAPCVFEHVYFSQPASTWLGEGVHAFRLRLGHALADLFTRQHPDRELDMIVPVPDSANFIGLGVAQAIDPKKFMPAILRNHDAGRTFIAADQVLRDWLVRSKFSVIHALVRDRSIGLVDDSVVRGTTMPAIVRMLRQAGAREVHALVGFPRVEHPCTYGINTPQYDELIAARMSTEEMRKHFRLDTLTIPTVPQLQELTGTERCFACLNGDYPLPV